jgi:hypothetical protein
MRYVHLILFSLCGFSAYSQKELPTGQIEVIKDFEVRLMETKKIKIIPQPIALDSTSRIYTYNLNAPSPSVDYIIPVLKPLELSIEKKPAYYPLYAKAGYGNPNSFLGNFSYDHRQNELLQWGIDLRHLSANNKKIPLQKFSTSEGSVNASYNLKENITIDANIDAKFENVYFYGADIIPSNPDALKRSFDRYDAEFAISNMTNVEQGFTYRAGFDHLFDKDDLGSRESAIQVKAQVENSIGKNAYPVGLKVMADLSTLKTTEERPLNNILLEPYLQFHAGPSLGVHLGGTVLLNKVQNEILPDLQLSYHLFHGRMTLMAGWSGEVIKNNFHSLSSINPYINTRLDSIGNRISTRIYAGLKGKTEKLQYEVKGGYTSFERMAFFLQDDDNNEQFDPVYDDGSFIGYEASVRYEVLKNVTLHANGWQRFYNLDKEEKPWHMPTLGIDGILSYSGGGDAYHASFEVHSENGVPYRTPGGTVTRLDPLIDISLHGDYYFTKAFGAFAELNNLLGNNRERWSTYPSFGFNAKAGFVFRL